MSCAVDIGQDDAEKARRRPEHVLGPDKGQWPSWRRVYPAGRMADVAGGEGDDKGAADKPPEPEVEWTEYVLSVPCCPPTEARPTDGPIYRRIGPEGLKTWAELGRGTRKPDVERCRCAALSVFTDLESLRAAAKVHEYTAVQPVVVALLKPEHGVIARTGPTRGHHSLWLRKKHMDARESLFKAAP